MKGGCWSRKEFFKKYSDDKIESAKRKPGPMGLKKYILKTLLPPEKKHIQRRPGHSRPKGGEKKSKDFPNQITQRA